MHKNGTKVCPIATYNDTTRAYLGQKREIWKQHNYINYQSFCLIFSIILVKIPSYIWSRILVKFYGIVFT